MKKMNIVIGIDDNCHQLVDFFKFNDIAHQLLDLWDTTVDQYRLPDQVMFSDQTLLILSYNQLVNLLSLQNSQQLVNFCQQNNHIWIWADIDGVPLCIDYKNYLLELDQLVDKNKITLFFDGRLSSHQFSDTVFQNIKFKEVPYSYFLTQPRIKRSTVDKINCSRDFMITTILQARRPHRYLLQKQLKKIPGLIDRGHVSMRLKNNSNRYDDWFGESPPSRIGMDEFPSMDLYLDSWLEIVPETLYKNGYYITEKTVKPIATKTPFLMVTSHRYLEYLRQQGFQTFNGIISEKYDQEFRIENRVKLVVDQLHDIVKNGAESFYQACRPVLEHNQNRLLEISGRKRYDLDLFLKQQLESIGVV